MSTRTALSGRPKTPQMPCLSESTSRSSKSYSSNRNKNFSAWNKSTSNNCKQRNNGLKISASNRNTRSSNKSKSNNARS